jgi:hypothetical protein
MGRILDFIGATLCLTSPADSTNPWVCMIGYESWGVSLVDHSHALANTRSSGPSAHAPTELASDVSL